MTELVWDQIGEHFYETGVDHAVLYTPNDSGVYVNGFAWNGVTSVTESPSGAEANPIYADNIKYLDLRSAEEFGGTLEAYTFPDQFGPYDGLYSPSPGVVIGQQTRKTFGLSYRTRIGNDTVGDSLGYKIHLIYGATATPSEKQYQTVNDSPEATAFSWELDTVPVPVPGMRPTSLIVIDSTKVDPGDLAAFEAILYGTISEDPRLPLPTEVISLFAAGALIEATPVAPTFDDVDNEITIPTTTGITYYIGGVAQEAGIVAITEDTVVTAMANAGYRFPDTEAYVSAWLYEFTE